MTPEAHKHLSKHDPVMRALILEHGQCALVPEKGRSPFQSLVQAVAQEASPQASTQASPSAKAADAMPPPDLGPKA